ncbi:MAG: hypothetical protein R3E84_03965 [Pseudomonadales bacterium]
MPPVVDRAHIATMLGRAERAYQFDFLAGPEPFNATDLYREVLSLEPWNEDAERGLERVAERFVAMALEAANRWQLIEARGLLARAKATVPDHPSIEPTAKQLDLLASAQRQTQQFDRATLNDGNTQTANLLASLGTRAKQGGCRTLITAPADGDGRWMYQKMNSPNVQGHLRANVRIGSPPGVELICFPDHR